MKWYWIPFSIATVLNLFSFIWLAFRVPSAPFPFIIHYQIFGGREIWGKWPWLFLLPSVGLIILALNFLIFLELFSRQKFLANLVAGSTVFIELLVFFGVWSMVYINT